MESEERHELKQNDLQAFFTNFGQWWEKYGNLTLIVVTIAAASVLGYVLYNNYQQSRVNTAWHELANSTSPAALLEVARNHQVGAVPAVARIRAADLLHQQAINPTAGEERSRTEALNRAATVYREVANDETAAASYRVNAYMGLASVAESRAKWQAARNHWSDAAELAKQQSLDRLAEQARARRGRLDQLRQSVAFTEAPASTQPGRPGPMGPGTGGPLGPGSPGSGGGSPLPPLQPGSGSPGTTLPGPGGSTGSADSDNPEGGDNTDSAAGEPSDGDSADSETDSPAATQPSN